MSDNPYKGPRSRPPGRPPARDARGVDERRPRVEPRAAAVSNERRPREEPRAARTAAPNERREPRAARATVPNERGAARPSQGHDDGPARPHRNADEVRLYGINACRAAFAARPQDLRKVYLAESRIAALRDVLAWCVKHRLGYRVVEDEDLDKLAASTHHEGVIFEMRRAPQPSLRELLAGLGDGAQVLLWLDGVGNPHNFGAVLRSAAHFGVAGVLLPHGSTLTLSGAATRVAEGGAEAVPVVQLGTTEDAVAALQSHGFTLAATLPRGAASLYEAKLPQRLVLVFGAEGEGLQPPLVRACSLQLAIPGSGRVESLNIANAVGVMLGEWWRRHRG